MEISHKYADLIEYVPAALATQITQSAVYPSEGTGTAKIRSLSQAGMAVKFHVHAIMPQILDMQVNIKHIHIVN